MHEMVDHPEGGRFLEVFRSASIVKSSRGDERTAMTHIYFALAEGEVSRFHKVASDEVWNIYEGSITLYVWDEETERIQRHELSKSSGNYCTVVDAGKWQAAAPGHQSALVGCSVAPGFEFADFTLIDPDGDIAKKIIEKSPELSRLI